MRKPRIVTVSHRRRSLDDAVSSSVVYLVIFLEFSTSIHPSTPDNRIVLFMWPWDRWEKFSRRTRIYIRLDFFITSSLWKIVLFKPTNEAIKESTSFHCWSDLFFSYRRMEISEWKTMWWKNQHHQWTVRQN